MAFIDSHAHLADSAFDGDRADVIARARAVGASDIVCIGESVAAAERAREIAVVNRGFVHFTAGVHPHDATSFVASRDLVSLGALCDAGAVAIGECGLDYHYDNSPREVQRAAFAAQLVLAADRGLPVVVHTRDAEADTHAMVVEAGAAGVRGVLAGARPEGNPAGSRGLALFYVEPRDHDGRLQNIAINRLKDKLGTRKLPTAELTLDATPAQLISGTQDGVREIAPMLNVTRAWNAVSAVSSM